MTHALNMKMIIVLLILCVPITARAWSGTVLSVQDGDSITVAPGGDVSTPVSIRLYGIDAPERDQRGGTEAWRWMQTLLPEGKTIDIISYDTDRYGRVVALIQVRGHTINGDAVAAGHAWVYANYCKARFCRQWQKEEKEARQKRLGLWREEQPTPPWKWRREHRSHEEE